MFDIRRPEGVITRLLQQHITGVHFRSKGYAKAAMDEDRDRRRRSIGGKAAVGFAFSMQRPFDLDIL